MAVSFLSSSQTLGSLTKTRPSLKTPSTRSSLSSLTVCSLWCFSFSQFSMHRFLSLFFFHDQAMPHESHSSRSSQTPSRSFSIASSHLRKRTTLTRQVIHPFSLVFFLDPDTSVFGLVCDVMRCDAMQIHIRQEEERDGLYKRTTIVRKMSFWCFHSGIAMDFLDSAGPRSFLLTSGTLSPLDSFAFELGLFVSSLPLCFCVCFLDHSSSLHLLCLFDHRDFPIRLENPHVIDSSQIWVGVLKTGPSGGALNTSYQYRDNNSYRFELGNALGSFFSFVLSFLQKFGTDQESMTVDHSQLCKNGTKGNARVLSFLLGHGLLHHHLEEQRLFFFFSFSFRVL